MQPESLVKSEYGFDDAVVATANLQWSAVEERLARGESAESIAAEYFVAYNIWLEQVLGETRITPTLNDLWIFFLVQAGAGYFHNDTPAFFSYLLYNALQLRNDSVGTFVRGEYERWYKIINLTLSTYKGIAVYGKLSNLLPYEYVFNFEDLDGMVRTTKFIRYYNALSPTAAAQAYAELAKRLAEANKPLVDEILASEKLRSGDKVAMKRDVLRSKAYKAYVKFITGEWKSAQPLFYKTYSDRAGWLGTVNNFYNPLAISLGVISASLLTALVINGGLAVGGALAIFSGLSFMLFLGRKMLDNLANVVMAGTVNNKSFGKPVRPDAGHEKAEISFRIKAFRIVYWATLGIAKLAWDTLVFHYALIAHSQLAGSVWLAGALNINFVLVVGLWLPFVLFFFLDTFSLMYLWEAGTGFIYSKIHGLGTIKSEAKKDRLKGNILDIMDENLSLKGRP